MSSHPRPSFPRRCAIAGLAGAFALAPVFAAQPKRAPQQPQPEQSQPPPKKEFELSEKTRAEFGKLKPLEEAQNWAGIIDVLNAIPVAPGSYDEAMVLNSKATTYIKKGEYTNAIEPWERVIQLSDQHGYFSAKVLNEVVFYLAQLYAQEGSTIKVPAEGQPGRKELLAKQQRLLTKALTYFKRVLDNNPKPTPEMLMTYATILYYKAAADSNNIDQALLKEARGVVERGLQASIKPKEGFYSLLLTILQQQNDMAGSAEILELLLKQTPTKSKDLWQLLMATYLQLSEQNRDKDPTLSREYMTRAIVTMERAQGLGFMNTPKDNMNLVTLYLTGVNQFTKGTEMLYNGMKSGKIENAPNNWRVLGRYYTEANMQTQAISVLQEAAKLFPTNGEIEIQIAQLYLGQEKNKEAFEHAKAAAAKGNFEPTTKPFSVHYLVAYTAYDLGLLDEARAAIAKAEEVDPKTAASDSQFPRLKNVVMEAINDRDAKAKEKAEGTEKDKEKNKKGGKS